MLLKLIYTELRSRLLHANLATPNKLHAVIDCMRHESGSQIDKEARSVREEKACLQYKRRGRKDKSVLLLQDRMQCWQQMDKSEDAVTLHTYMRVHMQW